MNVFQKGEISVVDGAFKIPWLRLMACLHGTRVLVLLLGNVGGRDPRIGCRNSWIGQGRKGVGKGREGGAFLPPPHRFDIRRINKHSERAGRKVAFEETLKEHNSDGIPLHELLHHCRPNPFKRSSMVDRNTWGNSNSLLGYR